uniref:Delta(14)-sterol reductase TM7SF2 n=1 Tax=Eptatretus burgeri TaxID=7764 RepID=A0A8C4PY87_EPTBU
MEKTPKFRPQLALVAGSGLRLLQRYLIVILIPLWMILACQAPSGALFPLPRLPGSWSTLWEPKAFLIVLAWCFLQAGLYLLPLGKVGEGPPMPNGVKLKYNLNGVQAFVITTGLMAYLWYAGVNLAYVYQHYLQLMIAAYTIGLIFCFLLYVKSFAAPIEELVPNANTGKAVLIVIVCVISWSTVVI